jgi:murein DD-endopeptidase MepM/ murein hydrolase activator NlpD
MENSTLDLSAVNLRLSVNASRNPAANRRIPIRWFTATAVFMLLGLPACNPKPVATFATLSLTAVSSLTPGGKTTSPLPTRGHIEPGQLVDYRAQSGDTLEAIAAHFHTTVDDIHKNNSGLPPKTTTLPPGLVLHVPIYPAPFTGTTFQMLPDSEVVAGPAVPGFDGKAFVDSHPGYLKDFTEYAFDQTLSGWEDVQIVARDFSVNPRILLALLEYRAQALTRSDQSYEVKALPLQNADYTAYGLALQVSLAAGKLNEGYYGWRTGQLEEIELADGRITRPDPWQNPGTVALQYLLAQWFGQEQFDRAVSPDGFIQTYRNLFGDPFSYSVQLIPGDLQQPKMQLPIEPDKVWVFSGGPHPVWGDGLPWAAIDFAPPAVKHGCQESPEWVTAVAPGVVARSGPATVVLDLDMDGIENTGWTFLYYHLADQDRVAQGTRVKAGDRIGHPSCEGGRATGTNLHIARRYNGEWISAAGPLAFDLSDWIVGSGDSPYQGTLSYYLESVLHACDCVTSNNQISLAPPELPTPTQNSSP